MLHRALFLALLGTAAHALPHSNTRVVYADSTQHLRDDWVKSISAHNAINSEPKLHKLLFCVKQRNLPELASTLESISNPSSSDFRQYLTYDQIGNLINNTEGTSAVVNWLTSAGVKILEVTPRGEYISASAPVSLWSKLLDTEFYTLKHLSSDTRLSRCNSYSLPHHIATHVQSVAYTTQLPPRRQAPPIRNVAATNTATTTPAVLKKAYNINSQSGSHGSQSVFESLGQYYSPTDLSSFAQDHGFVAPSITDRGGHKSDQECQDDPNNCGEANLDVQYITAVAPNVDTTFWYIAESNSLYYDYLVAVAKDSNPVLVHSISYGSIETEVESSVKDNFDTELIKLGLMGVTVLVATGDDGVANFQARSSQSKCGYNPSYPATSPYVTAVGATQGIESGSAEIACSSKTGGLITTGGGFSTYYAQPKWQSSAVKGYFEVAEKAVLGYDKTGRGYPDVAMAGHNYEVTVGGQTAVESGTSASTPVFAGFVSLVNSARLAAGKPSLGFLNPALYAANASSIFTDVTSGENNCCAQAQVCCSEGFHAAKGWDPLTGRGSVDFEKFKQLMA
jgi:tripeptidyl-peptidase-1